ncbi:DUF7139 domain-containing protein [Natronococcus occultus]|uniref:Cell division protein A N-terminal domain-containing protein n=1 Tax=Natronococcus occultus SP4 TaxID=694430 RepID=L0JZH5_9EURY|nr:hypothetical protein [Natronococcus occultus]AGB37499.1 hypothetical protein Natoc_1694 [Natronococcus occultus SP4]
MTTEQPPDGYLVDLYRQYVGEPDGYTDVYAGFALFFGGIGIGVTALLLFLWGSTYEARTLESAYYDLLQPAYALGLLSLPATMLGVVVLLPSDRRTLYGAVGGAMVAVLAVAGFLYAYPRNWYFVGDVDYTVEVVTTYAVGLTGLVAATGAALVAHYLELASRAEPATAEDADADADDGLSMADIREDIDEAMASVELSWGGVEKTDTKRLEFDDDGFDDVSMDPDEGTTTTRLSGVDEQVAGLKGLQGRETSTTASNSTVDDQTAKLTELREQRREERSRSDDGADGVLGRMGTRVRALFDRS